jgi:hypothetical protein
MHLSNVQTFLCSVVFNNELLQEQESTFVVNSLSHLNLCDPQMRSVSLLAIIALLISHNELNHKCLL